MHHPSVLGLRRRSCTSRRPASRRPHRRTVGETQRLSVQRPASRRGVATSMLSSARSCLPALVPSLARIRNWGQLMSTVEGATERVEVTTNRDEGPAQPASTPTASPRPQQAGLERIDAGSQGDPFYGKPGPQGRRPRLCSELDRSEWQLHRVCCTAHAPEGVPSGPAIAQGPRMVAALSELTETCHQRKAVTWGLSRACRWPRLIKLAKSPGSSRSALDRFGTRWRQVTRSARSGMPAVPFAVW